jgi:predicted ATPase
VWWVELAPVSEPELVVQAVAQVLMVKEQTGRPLVETLAHDLAPTELLLVLDNCEHLIDDCARLAYALSQACPEVRILATSREALAVEGERAWPVPPLTSPEAEGLAAGELEGFDSVRLFVERAGYRRLDFPETGDPRPHQRPDCQRTLHKPKHRQPPPQLRLPQDRRRLPRSRDPLRHGTPPRLMARRLEEGGSSAFRHAPYGRFRHATP